MGEQLRVSQYLPEQEEILFLTLEIALKTLPKDSCNQISNLVRILCIQNEDSISLIHKKSTEQRPNC